MIAIGIRDNVVLSAGELTYWDNGYPIIGGIAYAFEDILMVEVDVPDDFEPLRYCYTENDGFYRNPKVKDPNPYGIPDELVEQIKNDAITEVEEAVINGTDA